MLARRWDISNHVCINSTVYFGWDISTFLSHVCGDKSGYFWRDVIKYPAVLYCNTKAMRTQLKLMVLNEISENQQRYWDSSTGEDEDVHNILLRSKWQIISAFPSLKAFRSELASKSFCLSPAGCWLVELVVCHRLWIKIREQQKEKKMQIWMKCWLWKLQTADGSRDMRLQARWYAGLQKSSSLTERWRCCAWRLEMFAWKSPDKKSQL